MYVSQIKEVDLTVEMIDRLLFQGIADTGENADCIIVLGSLKASKYRVPVAVEAYSNGRSDKIMLCGGKLREFPDGNFSEAAHMRQAALKLGVKDTQIIMEESSQNTVENILFALIELQRAFWLNNVRKVLLVTTAYHMRRSLAIAHYLFPEHITIIPCPANDRNTTRENWMNNVIGLERARKEALKLMHYVKSGVIPDFQI